ncbi:MAG: macro domain-containing protein [Lachnospiraceae bacterium]|nr:macro domain-containing protein [Lachnospiraceae bacterium]
MPLKIIRNDITKMQVDAIVNTANELPVYSFGTDTAVYRAAGAEELLAARREIGVLNEGEAALTPGFRLPAKYIIHAASPFYTGEPEEREAAEEKLRACYRNSLALAVEQHCESIAFPLIATGSYGYPKEEGMRVALDEINAFLLTHEMMIYLVVFDGESTALGRKLYPDLEAYIDRNYVEERQEEEYGIAERRPKRGGSPRSLFISAPRARKQALPEEEDYDDFIEESESALKERLSHLSDTFQQYLLYLIEAKGLTNAAVYKRAIITKQLFSKIKLNPNYHPDKATAMRLCVGAELNLDETKDLLARAGYALSPCDKRDIIFSYFIEHGVFDMIEIDIALEEHGVECFIE